MKQVLIKQGTVYLEDIPAPIVEPGTVLVQVLHSCISAGTELSGIQNSGQPLWKKAITQPAKIKKAVEMVMTQGLAQTRHQIEGKMVIGSATGYSASGIVLEVGEGVEDLAPGDRVACAGAQCAHHAEIIRVPRNLTVLVPEGMDTALGSTVTLGAIALQGVRRATPTLGETFVVLGLGILGQLTVQMLRANGCRVVGTDLDRSRIELALGLGMDLGVHPQDANTIEQVARLTDGIGADGVIITAASPSDEIISTAFKMCRRKGRVVLVGDVGLHLNRGDFYQKELDFFISTSYGPGRYDAGYEERGLEYPVAYVRWTENRNMSEYLRLAAERKLSIGPLISATYACENVAEAYNSLRSQSPRPLMVLLRYPGGPYAAQGRRAVANPNAKAGQPGRVGLAVVGAGGFAKGMHLPNIQTLSSLFQLRAIVSRTGHNATAAATQFGAGYATTRYEDVLEDKDVHAVIISTRHHLHVEMSLAALAAGKHVLLEKPLALDTAGLSAIRDFFHGKPDAPVLLTGFNRRFSPIARKIHGLLQGRSNPMIVNYRMNAGYLPLDHWVHGSEGGGRNLGEACHIYDLFTYLTGSRAVSVQASCVRPATGYYSHRDNFVATIGFEDGSVANLTYTAMGSSLSPKERLDVFCDGKVISMEDYRKLEVVGAKFPGIDKKAIEKGQMEELEAFGRCIKDGNGKWPIPLWEQIQATEIALQVERQLTLPVPADSLS